MAAVNKSRETLRITNTSVDDKFYIQINLCIDNLHKKYIKSGTFVLEETQIKQRIGFILSEMESCVQSDENLILNQGFSLDILITKMPLQFRSKTIYSEMNIVQNKNASNLLRHLDKISSKIISGNNEKSIFSKMISHGIFDSSLFSEDNSKCLMKSLALSILIINSHYNFYVFGENLKKYRFNLNHIIQDCIPSNIVNVEISSEINFNLFNIIARDVLKT